MDYAEPAASSHRSFNKKSPKPVEDPADKYGRLYEESMNPFTQFHRKVNPVVLHIQVIYIFEL
jgi:homeobox protein cut-like